MKIKLLFLVILVLGAYQIHASEIKSPMQEKGIMVVEPSEAPMPLDSDTE